MLMHTNVRVQQDSNIHTESKTSAHAMARTFKRRSCLQKTRKVGFLRKAKKYKQHSLPLQWMGCSVIKLDIRVLLVGN